MVSTCPICGFAAIRKVVKNANGERVEWTYRCIRNGCHAVKPYGFERDVKIARKERKEIKFRHGILATGVCDHAY